MLNIVTDPPKGSENIGTKDPAVASEIRIEQNVILLSLNFMSPTSFLIKKAKAIKNLTTFARNQKQKTFPALALPKSGPFGRRFKIPSSQPEITSSRHFKY